MQKEEENIMKTVLCYGDSNTYGYNPDNGLRFPDQIRWTGRLQSLLGGEYRVIEEGCNGRTTVFDDPLEGWKNGMDYLKPCLNSHKPIDLVILMLGSNDLKETFHASAKEIADGAAQLVETIQTFTMEKQGFVPKILLISPLHIGEGIQSSPFYGRFSENAILRSKELAELYRMTAQKYNCEFADASKWAQPSKTDSLHMDAEGHKAFAEGLFTDMKKMYNIP